MVKSIDVLSSPRVKKEDDMTVCVLCKTSFVGHGHVCAPLGASGDRCCELCSDALVLPARASSGDHKRSFSAEALHIGKRMRMDAQVSLFQSVKNDDDDAHLQLRQVAQQSAAYIPSEAAADVCAPGIEFEFPVVLPGITSAKCAVKPPCARTRPDDLVIDIYIGFDNTLSMLGSGQVGLCTTLQNFPSLVTNMFKTCKNDDAVDVACVRASTYVHMFKFGERATAFDGQSEFVPFTDEALHTCCEVAAKNMQFDEGATNIELAVQYVSTKAHERFMNTRVADEDEGKTRVACVVLLTDGSVNAGSRCAQQIIADADDSVSDSCRGQRLAFYAIGLGESTTPQFLTSFARGGFWKHVIDPHYPSSAFDITIGAVLASVGVYAVSIRTDVERNGEVLADKSTLTTKNFGLMTTESCRARMLNVSIPSAALPGDVLVVNTRFGGLHGESFQSRIAIGTNENTYGTPIKGATMSEGLFAEAQDIEHALENLKTSITNGDNLQNATDLLIESNAGSAAVQAQLQRYSEILDNSLSCTSTVGTMAFVSPLSFGGGLFQPSLSMPTPSRWMVESSISQLYY